MQTSLEEEVKLVTQASRQTLLEKGSLVPMLYAYGQRGAEEVVGIIHIDCAMGSDFNTRAQAFRVLGARLQGVVGQLAFIIHAEEGWMRLADDQGQPDESTKMEVVSIFGVDPTGARCCRILRVIRDELGVLVDLQTVPASSESVHGENDTVSAFFEGYSASDPGELLRGSGLVALRMDENGSMSFVEDARAETVDESFADFR